MKRPRPHIPLRVRVEVAARQCRARGLGFQRTEALMQDTWGMQLKFLLHALGFEKPQLDHTPALILRPLDEATGKYTPDANDPDHLEYIEKKDHDQKTFGRRADAEKTVTTKGSDIWLKKKFDRLEGRTKTRPKAKIAQRKNPWPKRKLGQ